MIRSYKNYENQPTNHLLGQAAKTTKTALAEVIGRVAHCLQWDHLGWIQNQERAGLLPAMADLGEI